MRSLKHCELQFVTVCLVLPLIDMSCSSKEYVKCQNFMARSNITFESCSFKWPIENFSKFTSDVCTELKSPTFSCYFYLTVKLFETNDRISITLSTNRGNNCKVIFQISVIDKAYNKCNAQSIEFVIYNGSSSPACYISKRYLFKAEEELLPNDTLTILCELDFALNLSPSTTEIQELKKYIAKVQISIEDDFLAIYNSRKNTDFIIKVDKRCFNVHKLILIARSPMFAAMLEHGMQEAKTNTVEFEDKDPDAVEQAIIYMYTNKCPRIAELATDILPVADYFQLKGLRELCIETLVDGLNPENVSLVYILGDTHSIEELKTICCDFIKLHLKEVSKSTGWNELVNIAPWMISM